MFPLSHSHQLHRRFLAGAVGVLLLAAWLGGRGLTFDSIWYDEWRTLVYVGSDTPGDPADLSGALGRVAAQSDALNPPAYYLLLATWGTVAGTEPAVLRYFSVLLGLLTIAIVYRVGADWHSPGVGLTAAALLGSGATFSVFMHEMRAYPLAMLLVAAHLWTYGRVNRPEATWRDRLAFMTVLVALVHTHYTALLMLGGTFLYHVIFVRRRWWIPSLYVLAAVAMLPWVAVVLGSSGIENVQDRAGHAMPLTKLLRTISLTIGNEITWIAVMPLLLALGRGRLVWMHTVVGVAVLLALNAFVPFLCCRRYLLALLPALVLLIALGLTRWRVLAWFAVPLWMAAGIFAASDLTFAHGVTNSTRWHFPWGAIQDVYEAEGRSEDTVLVLLPAGISDWLHEGPAAYYLPDADINLIVTWRRNSKTDILADVAAATAGHDRVWTVFKPSWTAYYHEDALAQLAADLTACGVVREGPDAEVRLYAVECP